MKVLAALCMVAMAVSHPVNDDTGHVAVKSDGNQMTNEHMIHKRDIKDTDGDSKIPVECSEGSTYPACAEQNADDHVIQKRDTHNADDHVIQKRDDQNVEGVANQDENVQEAWSNEGGYAKQGEGGQYVYASDFGGPMVQILQHVYKSNCCECGCDCGCPGDEGTEGTEGTSENSG